MKETTQKLSTMSELEELFVKNMKEQIIFLKNHCIENDLDLDTALIGFVNGMHAYDATLDRKDPIKQIDITKIKNEYL